MATLQGVINFADGGTDMIPTTSGTPTAVTTPAPPFATYAMEIQTGDNIQFNAGLGSTSPFKATFKIRFNDVTPDADINLLNVADLVLRFKATSGDLEIRSANGGTLDTTITAPFSINTWHKISVWFQRSATGNAEIVIDGSSTTTTSKDYDDGNSGDVDWILQNATGSNVTYYLTEFTFWDAVTNNSDVSNIFDVYDYRCAGTPTTDGDALSSGSWANTGEQPLNESNTAVYLTGQADGAADFDSTGGGPAADSSTPTTTYVGGTYWQWARRGNGSASTWNLLWGSSGDSLATLQSSAITLDSAFGSFSFTTESTTIMPTSSENAQMGMEIVSGAREYILADQYFMLAVEQPASGHTATATIQAFLASINASGEQPHEATVSIDTFLTSILASGSMPAEGTAAIEAFLISLNASGEQKFLATAALDAFSPSINVSAEQQFLATATVQAFLTGMDVIAHMDPTATAAMEAFLVSMSADGVQTIEATTAINAFLTDINVSGHMHPEGTAAIAAFLTNINAAAIAGFEGTVDIPAFLASISVNAHMDSSAAAAMNAFLTSINASGEQSMDATAAIEAFLTSVSADGVMHPEAAVALSAFLTSINVSGIHGDLEATADIDAFLSSINAAGEQPHEGTVSIDVFPPLLAVDGVMQPTATAVIQAFLPSIIAVGNSGAAVALAKFLKGFVGKNIGRVGRIG